MMQITYMPYLNMGSHDETNIFAPLNIKIWNYGRKAQEYIQDDNLRTTVDAFMATNVAYRRRIEDMGIISVGDIDLRAYTPDEKSRCQEAALLLFTGALARGGILERGANTGHYISTSENFTIVEQNFEAEGEGLAVRDGYVVTILAGGYRASEVTFTRPSHVPTPMDSDGDARIIKDLLKMRAKQKRIYRRLLRAIDAFRQAYYNDSKMTEQSRILLMTSAYEILFDLPESGQRKDLKGKFRTLFVEPTDIKRRYKSERGPNRPPEWETESIKVMWADRFYVLRNKIIHGSPLKPADFDFAGKQRHFDIAVLFFVLGLRKFMGSTTAVDDTTDKIVWKKHHDASGEEDYEGFVYDKLDAFAALIADMRRPRS